MWEGFNGYPLRKDFPIRGIDTGARIYPEVFPEGGGPKAGSTGKDVKDVNIYKGEWKRYGTWPVAQIAGGAKAEGARAGAGRRRRRHREADRGSAVARPRQAARRADGARRRTATLKDKLFAAMAQTDCTACGWDCEGYAAALANGETKDAHALRPG